MYHFIINPASGSGRGRIIWEMIQKELNRLHITYQSYLLHTSSEAAPLAAAISTSGVPSTVIVIGGDGTINDVINGFTTFEHITFACIPTGSGNDFVRGLSLSRDPSEALQAVLHPAEILPVNVGKTIYPLCKHPQPSDASLSDVGSASGHHAESFSRSFMISSGIGFDAAVCYSVDHSRLKRVLNRFHLGKLVYLLTALWHLCTMKRPDLRISIDDSKTIDCKKAYFAAAMNLPYEGGGFCFAPNARPDDDQLDLIYVNGISRLHALCLLPLALKGKHLGHKGIHLVSCKKARIEYLCEPSDSHKQSPDVRNSAGCCVHTDGEVPAFAKTITLSLHEKKLAVIIR